MAKDGFIAKGGNIWLPNTPDGGIKEALTAYKDKWCPYYKLSLIVDEELNPLWAATDDACDKLMQVANPYVNENQKVYLNTSVPFLVLTIIDN